MAATITATEPIAAVEPTLFDPQPAHVPRELASPFDPSEPPALARRAADALIARIRGLPSLARDGKMFGVLVVRHRGQIGYLCAFSGMLDGAWHAPGFVPPLFDRAARDAFWPAGEAGLGTLADRIAVLDAAPERAAHAALVARHAAELDALRTRHRERRATRRLARAADPAASHALDQESRGDGAERRELDARHLRERAELDAALAELDRERAAVDAERAARSRVLLQRLHDGYTIANARGERIALRALFAPAEPPGGAGDCAAPKLLGYAYRIGAEPLALAELWWGAPPIGGGRTAGQFYPACRGKCGPLLGFMLQGVPHAPAPQFGDGAPDLLPLVFEDDWLIVVDKPCGLLSVRGRHAALADSVAQRLGAATVVHRLDLDTSGLLVAAKHPAVHAALQAAFARREIEKRYVAILDGTVARDHGIVELALRVDVDDRPRQIHDPVHGKAAVTEWRVIARDAGRTRVALIPRTGRTHQLRVHAAHPLGIGTPIVGDRLYGRAAERLLLHAEAIAFTHPHTRQRVVLESPAPF